MQNWLFDAEPEALWAIDHPTAHAPAESEPVQSIGRQLDAEASISTTLEIATVQGLSNDPGRGEGAEGESGNFASGSNEEPLLQSLIPEMAVVALRADDAPFILPSRILEDRPDVLQAFYDAYYVQGGHNSPDWVRHVGGNTPEAYARYWYSEHGRYEGYNQGPTTAGDCISLNMILQDRPDVLRAFYDEYYVNGHSRHPDTWKAQVGEATPEAYAKYWYEKYGKSEGYTQRSQVEAGSPSDGALAEAPPVVDPSLDPWNHPAIYPDWKPPFAGWEPPIGTTSPAASADSPDILTTLESGLLSVGRSVDATDPFG